MYKSLEHIIREIKEGKCCCDKKKDSLEGTIRKVQRKEYESSYAAKDSKPVDEDVAGLAGGVQGEPKLHAESGKKKTDESVGISGTDKFQGSQFKTVRTATPHIKPPGPEHGHSQAPENVSRQRTIAKEKTSMTMQGKVNEEDINEGAREKVITKGLEGLADILFGIPKSKGALVPHKPKVPTAPPEVKVPSKGTEVVPYEPKTPVKPAEPEPKTPVEPKAPAVPKGTDLVPVEPKTPLEPKDVTEPKVAPEPKTVTEPKVAPAEPKVIPTEPKVAEPKKPVVLPKGKLRLPGFGRVHARPVELTGPHAPVKTSISRAEPIPVHKNVYKEDTETRKEIENMPRSGDRKTIQYVGRKDADPKTTKEKTSRQAELKNKIISEAKKKADVIKQAAKERKEDADQVKQKVYPQVIINPNLNNPDFNNPTIREGLVGSALKAMAKSGPKDWAGQTAATAGLSGLFGAGIATGKGEDPVSGGIEAAKSVVTEPIRKYKEGDKLGAAADVAKTAHPIGAVTDFARYAAQTDIGRKVGKAIGDYVPGAKAAAEAAKRFREKIGGKSSFEPETPKEPEPPKQPETPKEPEQASSEIVPRKVKTTIEKESGGKTIKSFKSFNKGMKDD